MNDPGLAVRLRRLRDEGVLELPLPAGGDTRRRLASLCEIAMRDLPLARIVEAHTDATAILREAGAEPRAGATYGVWASRAPQLELTLRLEHDGSLVLDGTKGFCTGLGIVDRALVTAESPDSTVLVDLELDLDSPRLQASTSDWVASAFAETSTGTLRVRAVPVAAHDLIGSPGWYLDRPGFWHGALAPAACWAGGAIGLIDHCIARLDRYALHSHLRAQVGLLDMARWALRHAIDDAAGEIDRDPLDRNVAVETAYRFRGVVEHWVTMVLDVAVAAFGPRLLAHDAWASRRVDEVRLYVRQHHGAVDHERLGDLVVGDQ